MDMLGVKFLSSTLFSFCPMLGIFGSFHCHFHRIIKTVESKTGQLYSGKKLRSIMKGSLE